MNRIIERIIELYCQGVESSEISYMMTSEGDTVKISEVLSVIDLYERNGGCYNG
jgi:hypothetical protein